MLISSSSKNVKPVRQILGVALVLAAGVVVAGEHPTLPKVDTEMCKICHEELIDKKPVSHSPVEEDCTVCHEVSQGDDGTTITLSEPEPQLCFMCHDGFEDAVNGDVASPHAPVMGSCLFCHEVHGSEHPALLSAAKADVCAECHEPADITSSHSGQLPDNADCSSCHMPHGGPNERMFTGSAQHSPFADGSCDGCHRKPFGNRLRFRNRGEKQCSACHGSFEVPENGIRHEALATHRGRPGCLDCHDPHMSNQGYMLQSEGPELCGTCHPDVTSLASSDTGHYPAAEDCLGCHAPHVGERGQLLTEPPQDLCLGCHDSGDEDLSEAHLGADLAALECLTCHSPHGSEYGKSLAKNVHPPVLDGCETCHEGGHDELMEDGEAALCLICHEDVGTTAANAKVPHMALEVSRCVDCHNAHASPNDSLIVRAGGQVCLDCHDDQAPREGEDAHGAIDLYGCQACHLPHGGDETAMLRFEGDELCLGCHDRDSVPTAGNDADVLLLDRFPANADELAAMAKLELSPDKNFGHPTDDHRVGGEATKKKSGGITTSFEGVLGCLTCHDPHKGTGGFSFRWGAANRVEACQHCHEDK
jgi:predicted CXXCH cytochrome family protein